MILTLLDHSPKWNTVMSVCDLCASLKKCPQCLLLCAQIFFYFLAEDYPIYACTTFLSLVIYPQIQGLFPPNQAFVSNATIDTDVHMSLADSHLNSFLINTQK